MNTFDYKKYSFITGIILGASLSVLVIVYAVVEWKSYSHPGEQGANISVTGEGEIFAKPDIATISFSVREVAKTVPGAQEAVEGKIKEALLGLKKLGVEDKDIKTISYNVYPKYTQDTIYCVSYPCPQPKQKLEGYEVTESVEVKIRKIENAGESVAVLGDINITEISGPNFTVDNIKKLEEEAKTKAIKEAMEKAKKIADDLGVSLGEIIQYSESGGGYYPVMMRAMGGDFESKAVDVSIPAGETNIKTIVSITYTIR